MSSWERASRATAQLVGLTISLWAVWVMLPPSTRHLIRCRTLRRLSADLGHLARLSGRAGIWLEASGWEGYYVLYGAAARCRLTADDLWGQTIDAW